MATFQQAAKQTIEQAFEQKVNMKAKNPEQYIGKKYNHLTIASLGDSRRQKSGHIYRTANCVCDCGKLVNVLLTYVINGKTKSCRCTIKDTKRKKYNYKHVQQNPIYKLWAGIKDRCLNPNSHIFHLYGGRGIVICNEWKNNPDAFIDWAKNNGYAKGLHIDRENNDGNYEPSNCRFVTPLVNSRNSRNRAFFTFNNQSKRLFEWSEIVGISRVVLANRIYSKKWSIEKALQTPLRKVSNGNLCSNDK